MNLEPSRPSRAWTDVRVNLAGTLLCEPAWSWEPSPGRLRDWDLWYVWSGHGEFRRGDDPAGPAETLEPGAALLMGPGPGGWATHDPARRLGVCYLHFDFLDAAGQVVPHPAAGTLPPAFARVPAAEEGFFETLLRRAVRRAAEPGELAAREAASLLRAALLALRTAGQRPAESPAARESRRRLAPALQRLRERHAEGFDVAGLARLANLSPGHFSRLFRTLHGVSPKEFAIRARLERARTLLAESPLGIEEIADALGYTDVFFFSRQFKARAGLSPTAWRARLARGGL